MFLYCRKSGTLIWRDRGREQFNSNNGHRVFSQMFAGTVAGTTYGRGGRRAVMVHGFGIRPEHRVIWTLHHGRIPDGMVIDHINGDPSDNRIENLRACTETENARNSRNKKHSASRFKGVARYNQRGKIRWRARICTDGGRLSLGLFDSESEAFEAYRRAANKHHGEYARTH